MYQNNTETKLETFVRLRHEFAQAAARLNDAFEQGNSDGSRGFKQYPFTESFDEMTLRILRWAEADPTGYPEDEK